MLPDNRPYWDFDRINDEHLLLNRNDFCEILKAMIDDYQDVNFNSDEPATFDEQLKLFRNFISF